MKRVFVILIMAAMVICSKGHIAFAEELPIENQPVSEYRAVHNEYYDEEENIRKTIADEKERGEDETREEYEERLEQEYQARLKEFYQETRTIYFFEKRHQTYRDKYDPAAQALIIHPFDYRNPRIYMDSLNYLNALNFDAFVDFGAVSIPMSSKAADRTRDNLIKIIGIELIYNNESPDGLVYLEEKYDSRYGSEETIRDMDVYLQSVTVYDKRTEEILAQKHVFDDDSPVWGFEREVEEDDSVSSTGCFIKALSP